MSAGRVLRELQARLEGRVEADFPLAALTTYRLGGPARVFVEPAHLDDVERLARVLADAREDEEVPILALGRGSNLVVSDRGWSGVVVRLGSAFSGSRETPGGVVAGAATPLPTVANWAARRGLRGAEFTIAVPGSVGGAVRMNAGAHGREMADCLSSARVFDLRSCELRERERDDLALSYRRSNLRVDELVLEAELVLERDDAAEIRKRMEAYRRHRAETQPGAAMNAGSVFRNPTGDSAGRLVEAAGLKGLAVGGAHVSELHANFFIASLGARAQDVYDLVHAVRARVRDAFGVELEPEITFVGPFEDRVRELEQASR